jgi:hypothetical protein
MINDLSQHLFSNPSDLVEILRLYPIVWVPMRALKPLVGGQKLGSRVVRQLEAMLASNGVGFIGDCLPKDQNKRVFLYLKEPQNNQFIMDLREAFLGKDSNEQRELRKLLKTALLEIEAA